MSNEESGKRRRGWVGRRPAGLGITFQYDFRCRELSNACPTVPGQSGRSRFVWFSFAPHEYFGCLGICDNLYPLNLGLYSWNSQAYTAPELRLLVIVGSMVAIIPVIIAFLLLQRYWRAGLADGSIK